MPLQFKRIRTVTAGERLFSRLAEYGEKELIKGRFSHQGLVRFAGRGEQFGEYLEGAVLAFTFKRVMKAASGIFQGGKVDVDVGNRRLNSLLKYWFDWLNKEELAALMRDTIRASEVSHKTIPNGIKEEIFFSRSVHDCCFCGTRMSPDSNGAFYDNQGKKATLEHIWPSSLGGDSIEENLVPACGSCNAAKADIFVWEQGLVHDLIYPVDFHNSDFFHRVPVYERLLLQRRAVMFVAQRDKSTLKDALKKVGPYGVIAAIDQSDTWDFFNIQNHSESLGERLW
ncbi:HNH endonuclease [Cupriavidus sp. Marseille-Q8015]